MAEAEMRFAVFLTLFVAGVCSIPEQGKWQMNFNEVSIRLISTQFILFLLK